MFSDSSVKIIGLPGLPQEGLGIDKACAVQPDLMRVLGFEIFRQVRLHRDLSADSDLLYLEDRFQSVLKETWLKGHRTVLKILDVCRARLNPKTVEGVLYEHGKAQAIVGFYLASQKYPRKLIKIIEGLEHNGLVEFATNVGNMQADASITAWIKIKFEKSKRKPIIKYPLAQVPRRDRKRKKGDTAEEDTQDSEEDSEDSEDGDQVTETRLSRRKRTSSSTRGGIEGITQRRKSPVLQMPLQHSPNEKTSQGGSLQSAIQPTLGEHYNNPTEQALESGLKANKKETAPEPSLEQTSASVLMEEGDHPQLATDLLESDWPGASQYFDQRFYELPTTEPEWSYPSDTTGYFNTRGPDVF